MKDLTEQSYDELNAQVVRMLEHSLNQASRIAELETKLQEQDAMLGRRPCINNRCMDMVSAQSRIADLERRLAAPSAPAVEWQPGETDFSTPRVDAMKKLWEDDGATRGAAYICMRDLAEELEHELRNTAPQAADTDKVREAQANPHATTFPNEIWLNVGDGDAHEVGPYKDLSELSWCWERIDKYDVRYVRADLAASMAAQAPVREVPGAYAPKEGEKGWRPACCDGGGEGSPCCDFGSCAADDELAEMRAAAPVQQEGA